MENLRLDLANLRKKSPYDALRYVRKVIGYDSYLEGYAAYRHTSAQVLWEIADEITETAKGCTDIRSFRERLEEMSLQMKEQGKKKGTFGTGVALLTMHGAKGLEFHSVFLPTLIEGSVPHEKGLEQIEEERRLFYVAMTRAKERLILSAVREKYDKEMHPSRFLKEMGLDTEVLFRQAAKK